MRRRLTVSLIAALTMLPLPAPADGGRGGVATCVEMVNFRLVAGTDPAAFLEAARATEAPLRALPGFLRRRLVLGADGQWTDREEWRDAASAQAAGAMMETPAFGAFMAMIDGASVVMRHEALAFAMD